MALLKSLDVPVSPEVKYLGKGEGRGVARPGGNFKFHWRELPATWAPSPPGKFSFFFSFGYSI